MRSRLEVREVERGEELGGCSIKQVREQLLGPGGGRDKEKWAESRAI